jgi:signal transduction histidine kinase
MNTSYLRLNKSAAESASDPRAWLSFALEAAAATRWEIVLPGNDFCLTDLWRRMTDDESATAIPRADLIRLRQPLAALLQGDVGEFTFEFSRAAGDRRPESRRVVVRLIAAEPATGRPRRLRGITFRLPHAPGDHAPPPDESLVHRRAELAREFETLFHALTHEIRGPARVVAGFAQSLSQRTGPDFPEDARRLAEHIADAGRHLESAIEGLWGLARLARHDLTLARIDLASLAREVWGELAPGDARHAARLVLECVDAPPVLADRALARTLLRNLLENAFKYTRDCPGSPVTLARVVGPPPHFVLRDEGAGFDSASAKNLFEPFGRQHPPGQFDGAGLGLAIVRRIAEVHGGRVWAESRVGEGTAVSFLLPGAPA